MSGTITRRHLPMIREIYGDRVANAVMQSPRRSTFLSVLIRTKLEDEATMREVDRLCSDAIA